MKRIVWALVALVMTLAACGDSGTTDTTRASSPGPSTIDQELQDFAFDPSSITVPAGVSVTVSLSNTGGITHDWVLLKAGKTASTASDVADDDVIARATVEPGQVTSTVFTVADPGSYELVCTIAGHLEAGMKGVVVVTG